MSRRRRVLEIRGLLALALPAAVVMSGLAGPMGHRLLSIVGDRLVLAAALYWIALELGAALLVLPGDLGLYSLGRKFGLVTYGSTGFVKDLLRVRALSLGAGLLVVVFTYLSISLSANWWWLGAWAGVLAVEVVYSYLLPSQVMPLFFRLRPLERAQLTDRLRALSARTGFPVSGTYEWQLSDRTRIANAAICGIGQARRIFLSDTLLQLCSDDEIESLVAHELGHFVHHDVERRLFWNAVGRLAVFWSLNWLAVVVFDSPVRDIGTFPGLVLGFMILNLYLRVFLARLSRRQEYAADQFAFEILGDPAPFASAMRKLTENNLVEYSKAEEWRFGHPATAERIAAAERYAEARAASPAN